MESNRLTQSELAEFYSLLLKRRDELRNTMRQHEYIELKGLSYDDAGERAPTRFHQADQATFTTDEETFSDLVSREIHKAQEIEAALDRIDGDRYGICERCDEMIAFQRLLNIPEARYCLRCERDYEQSQNLRKRKPSLKRRDFNIR